MISNIRYLTVITVICVILNKCVLCNRCIQYQDISPEASFYCYEKETAGLQNDCNSCSGTNVIVQQVANNDEAHVVFDYKPNNEYVFELKHIAGISDRAQCNQSSGGLHRKHSIYSYKGIDDRRFQPCTKNGSITLKYLYTGCFALKRKCTSSGYVCSSNVIYFDVNSTQIRFSNDTLKNFRVQSSKSQINVEVWHSFVRKCPNVHFVVNMENNSLHFNATPADSNCSEVMHYNHTICNFNNPGAVNISCYKNDYIIWCEIRGLVAQQYNFSYEYSDIIPCPYPPSLWGNGCAEQSSIREFNSEYTISDPPLIGESSISTVSLWTLWFILGTIMFVVVVIGLLSVYFFRQKYRSVDEPTNLDKLHNEECLMRRRKILLLYAKDASIVMKTLETFRKTLIAEGFEVFDVYDENEQRNINKATHKWIIEKLADEQMKIILVQTYCGLILSKYADAGTIYKKPTCYDNYFPYALSIIRSDSAKYNYKKLFVINLGFEEMIYNAYPFPVSRIYGLPDNYKFLLEDLHRDTQSVNDTLHETSYINEFMTECNKMKSFIEDITYLSDILKVSILNSNYDNFLRDSDPSPLSRRK